MHDRGSKTQRVTVLVQGVPMYGVVDSTADLTIIGGDAFKQVAAAAKLKKRDFKSPDQLPHNYDRRPIHLDGRINLDIEFLEKTMSTPIYVKMDAHEQLLLSEGVCRQLGIITYHPEVQTRPPTKPVECSSVPKDSGGLCQIPSVKVQLVKSVKLPPNHSVMVETRLVGESRSPHGPMLLEADNKLGDVKGLQLVDELIQFPDDSGFLMSSLLIPQGLPKGWKKAQK